LPQNNEPQNTWQIGIPFTDGAHTDTVKLKITQEGKSNQNHHQSNWSVVLELNPPGMGIIHCKISLIDNKVDTYFWSDFQSGILQVQNNLDLLANRYAEAGLAVGNLNVVDGARMASEIPEKELTPTLLDDFA
jgi:flagellar hook-length control protein FliK